MLRICDQLQPLLTSLKKSEFLPQIRGAEELSVSARSEYTTAYLVEKGTLMRWSFRVKDFDIGFGVRVRVMQDGGSVDITGNFLKSVPVVGELLPRTCCSGRYRRTP